jgi:hypothetical protein
MRIALLLLSVSAAYAQVNRTIMIHGDEIMITFKRATQGQMRLITGAPYSGDLVDQHTQTLADGTVITDPPGSQHNVRDSQGRTRVEMPLVVPRTARNGWEPRLTQITDLVAGFQYVLDDQSKIAHRVKMNEKSTRDDRRKFAVLEDGVAKSDQDQHETRLENLGTKTIEGVLAKGIRTTTTWPAGTRYNDRPIVNTQETWFSEDLQEVVYLKLTSLRSGEVVHRLDKVDRAEPDPVLFQPPADYKIVDEESSFTITLRRPQ